MKRVAIFILSLFSVTVLGFGTWSVFDPLQFSLPARESGRVRVSLYDAKLILYQVESPGAFTCFDREFINVHMTVELIRDGNGKLWESRAWSPSHWVVYVHGIIPLILFGAYPTIAAVGFARRRSRLRRQGACIKCGYNLTGNVSGVCSECGVAVRSTSERR